MALVPIIALINAYNKKTLSSYIWYWLSLVMICLWALDVAIGVIIATLAIFTYICIKQRKKLNFKHIFIPLIVIIIVALVGYIGICLIKNINPITRAIEFIKISMSNESWGLVDIGKTNELNYVICYYLVPVIVVGTLIYTIYKSKGKLDNKTIALIALGLFYIINFQRGIVRHSLVEKKPSYISNFALIYFAIFVTTLNKENMRKALFTYTLCLFASRLIITPEIFLNTNLVSQTINQYSTFTNQDAVYTEKVSRYETSEEIKTRYGEVKKVCDTLLNENETYLDMSNQNLMYVFIDKEKPVYVNQTPALVSGEETQQIYIEEVEKSKKPSPIVIKTKIGKTDFDEIPGDYKFYLLSEYVNKNYTPVADAGEFEIWLKNSEVESRQDKLKPIQNIRPLSKQEYINENPKDMNLKNIPLVWGTYDKKKDDRKVIKELGKDIKVNKEKEIEINTKDINKENGNYIELQITSDKEESMNLELYNNEKKLSTYTFNITKGTHKYIVRPSIAYNWYEGNINNIKLKVQDKVDINSLTLLEANTLKNR